MTKNLYVCVTKRCPIHATGLHYIESDPALQTITAQSSWPILAMNQTTNQAKSIMPYDTEKQQ